MRAMGPISLLGAALIGAQACGRGGQSVADGAADLLPVDAPAVPEAASAPLALDFSASGCGTFDAKLPRCNGTAPLSLTFTPIASAEVTRFLWTFGDDTPDSSDRSAVHLRAAGELPGHPGRAGPRSRVTAANARQVRECRRGARRGMVRCRHAVRGKPGLLVWLRRALHARAHAGTVQSVLRPQHRRRGLLSLGDGLRRSVGADLAGRASSHDSHHQHRLAPPRVSTLLRRR